MKREEKEEGRRWERSKEMKGEEEKTGRKKERREKERQL